MRARSASPSACRASFTSEESLKAINFRSNNRFFRLSDIADGEARLRRSAAADVPLQRRAGHRPRHLHDHGRRRAGAWATTSRSGWPSSTRDLPVGIELHLVADQPHVVEEAVGEFTKSLLEAIAIVLAVSFLALGWRPGHRGGRRHSAGAGDHVRGHEAHRHLAAAHLARRADHRARPAGRRRHDRGRDDDHQARGGLRQDQGRDLRLHVDGISRC